ncbi:hypothetical protein NDU88_006864 [Pleurodeles waltl]|uniref:Uncharacterized protein n=1 Tax=Pleurodeles waltl TaxID=8319 RepID=A0AAV7N499_PLEWA|nr:hypothetical protein NDU88_006864 [Pleurodeles waltl]
MTVVRLRPQQTPAVMVQQPGGGSLDRCAPTSRLADRVVSAARSKYRGQRKQREKIDRCVLLYWNAARISFSKGGSGGALGETPVILESRHVAPSLLP